MDTIHKLYILLSVKIRILYNRHKSNYNILLYSHSLSKNYFHFLREFSSSIKVKLQSGIKKSTAIAKRQPIF